MTKLNSNPTSLYRTAWLETPIGWVRISGNEEGVREILFEEEKGKEDELLPNSIVTAHHQLKEYFNGERREFDFQTQPTGTTFQTMVWKALLTVPYGHTTSYQHIANLIGNPKAVRAVGAANGSNPISIVLPCHRIVGSTGKLTGYGGGIHRKKWLLEHEQKIAGGYQQRLFE